MIPFLYRIESLFARLEKRLNIFLRINSYDFMDGKIIKNNGIFGAKDEIPISQISEWEIYPEMGFDVVILKTKEGGRAQWIDRYNDLIDILETNVGPLQQQTSQ